MFTADAVCPVPPGSMWGCDLALAGDAMAANRYGKLTVNADACTGCVRLYRLRPV